MKKTKGRYDVILIRPNLLSPYKAKFPPFAYLFLASNLAEKGYKVTSSPPIRRTGPFASAIVKIFDAQIEKSLSWLNC